MPKTLKPILNWQGNPIEGDRMAFLHKKHEDCQSERTYPDTYQKLRNIILSFGGDEALIPKLEEDIERLIKRGECRDSKDYPPLLMEGEPSQCHRNSCNLWEANKEDFPDRFYIETGYGLTLDQDNIGLWRQHTWLFDIDQNWIVETTEKRMLYFGYQMTYEEATHFVNEHS